MLTSVTDPHGSASPVPQREVQDAWHEFFLAADRPTQVLVDVLCLSKHTERDLEMYADVWIRTQ